MSTSDIAVPPSAAVFTRVNPVGKAPDCNSKVTLPADSGSVAFTLNEPATDSNTLPNDPAPVTNTGEASNSSDCNLFCFVAESNPPSVGQL